MKTGTPFEKTKATWPVKWTLTPSVANYTVMQIQERKLKLKAWVEVTIKAQSNLIYGNEASPAINQLYS